MKPHDGKKAVIDPTVVARALCPETSTIDNFGKNVHRDAAIKLVFGNPGVRGAIYRYRHFLKTLEADRDITERLRLLERSDDELAEVIGTIAKAYRSVTGKSPKTTDPVANKYPFGPFVKQLFAREGLEPRGIYAIKKALKK